MSAYDLPLVIKVLNTIVASNPSRRDEPARNGQGGRYARHGRPCCLVGEVLVNLGASVGTLKELDRDGRTIDDSPHPFWRRFDPIALQLLTALQRENDSGHSWGGTQWNLFRIDPYWKKRNPRFAYPGPWCTDENGHVSERNDAPKF